MWSFPSLLCVGLLWTGAAFAQQMAGSTLQGRVVNDTTGAPVPGASVMIYHTSQREGAANRSTSADASGGFTFTDLGPGPYRVAAEKNRYVRTFYGQRRPNDGGRTVNIVAGEQPERVEIRLTPAAVLTGRVIDENGEPVPYVQVSTMTYRYMEGERRLVSANGAATTDDLGEYRIFGLAPGRYYVSARTRNRFAGGFRGGRRGRPSPGEDDAVYPVIYYPGTFDAANASPVELRASEERSGVDFRLARSAAVTVSGLVTAADGSSLDRRSSVMLVPRDSGMRAGMGGPSRFNAGTGEFEVSGVLPGAYYLIGMTRSPDNPLSGRLAVDVGPDDINGLHLVLSPGETVAGRIELPADPLEAVDFGRTRVALRSGVISLGRTNTTVDEDGRFHLDSVAQGEYAVSISGLPADSYVAGLRLSDRKLAGMTIEVLPGGVSDLVIRIGAPGGALAGRTLAGDSQPQPGATVALVPEDPARTDLYGRTRSDESGAYSLRAIAPGKYTLYAFDDLEPGAEMDPDVLSRYKDDGVKVEIEDSAPQTLDLPVAAGGAGSR